MSKKPGLEVGIGKVSIGKYQAETFQALACIKIMRLEARRGLMVVPGIPLSSPEPRYGVSVPQPLMWPDRVYVRVRTSDKGGRRSTIAP